MAWATPFKVLTSVVAALADGTFSPVALDNHARLRQANPDAVDQYQKFIALAGSVSTTVTTDTLLSDITAAASANYLSNAINYAVGATVSKSTSNTGIATLISITADGVTALVAANYNLLANQGTTGGTTKLTWNGTVRDNLTPGALVALQGGAAGLLTVTVPARPGGAGTLTDVVALALSGATFYLKRIKINFDTPLGETAHITIYIGTGTTQKKIHYEQKLTQNANQPNSNMIFDQWSRGRPIAAGTPIQVFVRTAGGNTTIMNIEIEGYEEV